MHKRIRHTASALMLFCLSGIILVSCRAEATQEPSPTAAELSGPTLRGDTDATASPGDPQVSDGAAESATETDEQASTPDAGDGMGDRAKDLASDARVKIDEVARKIDQDPRAKDAAAGILQPIYVLAEFLSFSAFYWLAFTLMAAGVVSHAFQLIPGKLVVLLKGSLNIREILSDAIGLIISTLGLILTTQAATQNSEFTQSPAAVLSATVAGALLGLVMYRWAQSQEIRAVAGQRLEGSAKKR